MFTPGPPLEFSYRSPPPLSFAAGFRLMIVLLCQGLGNHQLKDRTAGPLLTLIVSRVQRRASRFMVLLTRLRSGIPFRLRPRARLRARKPAALRPAAQRPEPAPVDLVDRLLRRRGCLVKMTGAGLFCSQLTAMLDDPDMKALLAATPETGRVLRPLWRMLSFDPPPEALRRVLPPPPSPPSTAPPPEVDAAGPPTARACRTTSPRPQTGPAASPPVGRQRPRRPAAGPSPLKSA